MNRSVTVHLSDFAREAVAGARSEDEYVPARVVRAIHCYLHDRELRGPGWAYPGFMRDESPGAGADLRLNIDEDLWRSLEEEASQQGVSAQQMATHAALYVAAEVDAGHVTERILEEVEDEDDQPAPASRD